MVLPLIPDVDDYLWVVKGKRNWLILTLFLSIEAWVAPLAVVESTIGRSVV